MKTILIKKYINSQLLNLVKLSITYLAKNNYSNALKILFPNENMTINKQFLYLKEVHFDLYFQELHQRKNFSEALKKAQKITKTTISNFRLNKYKYIFIMISKEYMTVNNANQCKLNMEQLTHKLQIK